jgi:hypothetical protein
MKAKWLKRKLRKFRKQVRTGVSLSYSSEPHVLGKTETWAPPGKWFDLSWIGLLLLLVIGCVLV